MDNNRALTVSERNKAFWNELCGSTMAKRLGIRDDSAASLRRFDDTYLKIYPYLLKRVPLGKMKGKRVLEVGLGYGTLSQKIAEAGALYTGLDIAEGPVSMVNHRLHMAGADGQAMQGSMLNCPLPDASQDYVVSIGCFHHTGDVQRSLDEAWRVLKPGGEIYLMVYNRFSYRQWLRWPLITLKALVSDKAEATTSQKKSYDPNIAGEAAPETVFLSIRQLEAMLARFDDVKIAKENCIHVTWRGRTLVPRALLLGTLGRLLGLDLYASARKK